MVPAISVSVMALQTDQDYWQSSKWSCNKNIYTDDHKNVVSIFPIIDGSKFLILLILSFLLWDANEERWHTTIPIPNPPTAWQHEVFCYNWALRINSCKGITHKRNDKRRYLWTAQMVYPPTVHSLRDERDNGTYDRWIKIRQIIFSQFVYVSIAINKPMKTIGHTHSSLG